MTCVIDTYGLSPLQAGMLFHSLGGAEPGVDIEQVVATLREPVHEEHLLRAWDRLLERHSILRTRFGWESGAEPVQEVVDRVSLPVKRMDLRPLGEAERQTRFQAVVEEERRRGFDLRQAPLMRLVLVRAAKREHWMLWTVHHILLDGHSRFLLFRELFALYEAFVRGGDLELPVPRPYRTYIEWLGTLDERSARGYWAQLLAGFQSPTPLVVARPTEAELTGSAVREVRLSAALTNTLRVRARESSVTLNTLVQGAWALLLHRYSGEADIVFGTTRAGRRSTVAGADEMWGLLINTLPMRVRIEPGDRLSSLLQRLRAQHVELRSHEHTSLVQVQGWSEVPRGSPLFESLLVFDSHTLDAQLRAEGGRWNQRSFAILGQTNYPLTLAAYGDEQLLLQIEYSRRRFADDAVARMLGHLHTLLEGMAADPNARLEDLAMLPEAERHQVLEVWNRTSVEYPAARCVHELVEEQARTRPDALAVQGAGQQLTYRELDERAASFAGLLSSLVRPGSVVAVYLERSVEMVVAILAVWKAGAAYVPIDPEYPKERVRFMLEDTRAVVVLTRESLAGALPAAPAAAAVVIVPMDAVPVGIARNTQRRRVPPEQLAYVIYTSGSTGRPKGVPIEHRSLCNLICWHRQAYDVGPADRATQVAGPAFDAAVWEIWPYLAAGASVHIPDDATRLDAASMVRWLTEHRITLSFLPTPLAEAVLREEWPATAALRVLLTGGDRLDWPARPPPFRLVNHYGPTENTVVSTCAEVCARDGTMAAPPIGRPLPNTRAYVVDRRLQPVPIGVPGELLVGGAQLSPGYWNRPELTAETFLADPFCSVPGARVYRTGDLVRWLPDGELEFLGRIDQQVKIRGFRIEPGEIEAHLAAHPAIVDAAIVAREDARGDRRLVAYLVADQPPGNLVGDLIDPLRARLRAALPEYMVPAVFVLLDRFPLTQNGKLDRKALPLPDAAAYAARTYEAPRGAAETALAQIWCEVLGLERVGRGDHFFELGGHSLLAVRVIERMRRAGLHADVRALFVAPTLDALAAAVGGDHAAVAVPQNGIPPGCQHIAPEMLPLVQLTPEHIERIAAAVPGGAANIQDIYPLAPLQEGILFHHRMAQQGDPYLLRVAFAFDTRARLEAYVRALQTVIDRHDVLRTAVVWEGLPEPVQVVWRRATVAVEEISLRREDGDAADQLWARFDPGHFRLDVRQAPLLRLFVAQDAVDARWVMLQLFHHLASDHTTLEIVQQEIQACLLDRAAQLPEPLPFRTFVAQTRLGIGPDEHRAFFQELLGDVDEPTAPFGLRDVLVDATGISEARRAVEPAVARRLRARTLALGVSAASIHHLAWARVLAQLSGRDDVVFGTVLAGRHGVAGVERALGLFINTLPVRIRVGDEGVQDGVRNTHALLAQLLRHEHAPLSLAQRCSAMAGAAPLFSALFNYRHSTRVSGAGGTSSADARRAWEGIESLGFEERTNYPLALSVDDLGEGFALTAQAQAPIDPARICAYMHTALEQMVDALERAPTTPLHRLGVLPLAERQRVLEIWNRTSVAYPATRCVHELVEDQARKRPHALAVQGAGQQLTYRELDERAAALAALLTGLRNGQAVRPGFLVAVYLERSVEMVVAILAVWKAGGAYVPIDPEYPKERVRFMLEDTRAVVVLTRASLAKSLPAATAVTVHVDALPVGIAGSTARRHVPPEALAYVIYTSGSTGRPKGVPIEHQSLCNLICWHRQAYDVGPADRATQVAGPAFDAAAWEIWPYLAAGASVHIPDDATRLDARSMVRWLTEHRITLSFLPTPLAEAVLREDWPAHAALRVLLTGGDRLGRWPARPLPFRLVNHYGPTENTVVSTCAEVRACDVSSAAPPIGRPLPNTRVYVVDRRLQPVPIGVPGELLVGGAQLSPGYWNRPELTAETFLADPFCSVPGARVYRTGDLVRWLPDGELEFLGRIDQQVKIRGFRIEPGEIEAHLAAHPAIVDAAIVAREDAPGDRRLVAYLVVDQPPGNLVGDLIDALRARLRAALPEYMVPAAFVLLDRFPLTQNGKLDRKALPAPNAAAYGAASYEAPRGATEMALAQIWSELLGLERVGRGDHFFDLGGHSLLAMQVVSRVLERLHVELPLRDLFATPTVSHLAERIEALQAQAGAAFRGDALSGLADSARSAGVTSGREQLEL